MLNRADIYSYFKDMFLRHVRVFFLFVWPLNHIFSLGVVCIYPHIVYTLYVTYVLYIYIYKTTYIQGFYFTFIHLFLWDFVVQYLVEGERVAGVIIDRHFFGGFYITFFHCYINFIFNLLCVFEFVIFFK